MGVWVYTLQTEVARVGRQICQICVWRGTMDVEFTARQVKISKITKDSATEAVDRIGLVLGKITSAKLTFWSERHLQVVEVSLQSRQHNIVAKGESASQETALRQALAHAELQAQRFRDKIRTKK